MSTRAGPCPHDAVDAGHADVHVRHVGLEPGSPEGKVLRTALFAWAFNPATRDTSPPEKITAASTGPSALPCRSPN